MPLTWGCLLSQVLMAWAACANPLGSERGVASFYGEKFWLGRKTADGEVYTGYSHTAAHRWMSFNTIVKVIDEDTGRYTIVRITDRGPFKDDRIIDLDIAAAQDLDLEDRGLANVRIERIGNMLPKEGTYNYYAGENWGTKVSSNE